MCRDVDGRQIKVGDYVKRVKMVDDFKVIIRSRIESGFNYSTTGRYRVTVVDSDNDYIGIDCDKNKAGWFSDQFRVVESGPPTTTREMSYKLLRELNIA